MINSALYWIAIYRECTVSGWLYIFCKRHPILYMRCFGEIFRLAFPSSICNIYCYTALEWRHNVCCGVSNHRRLDCSLNCLFRRRSKKTSNLRLLAFVREIHRWPMNSPHKGPVTRKKFQFDDVIIWKACYKEWNVEASRMMDIDAPQWWNLTAVTWKIPMTLNSLMWLVKQTA